MTQITDSMALAFYILHPRTLLGLPRNQLQRAMIQIIQREGWGKGREYQMKLQLKIIMLLLSVRKWLNLSLHSGTHRHTLAPPSPPPQTQTSIATRQKRIVLLTNAGFIRPREVFSLSTTPFPAPIKQNTSLKRPLLPPSVWRGVN